jgi:hypothetical protein
MRKGKVSIRFGATTGGLDFFFFSRAPFPPGERKGLEGSSIFHEIWMNELMHSLLVRFLLPLAQVRGETVLLLPSSLNYE